MEIDSFFCFKNNHKETEKQPDYKLSVKSGESYLEIGAGWMKEDKNKNKYIAFNLSKQYGERSGWKLVEQPLKKLEYPVDADPNNIPF